MEIWYTKDQIEELFKPQLDRAEEYVAAALRIARMMRTTVLRTRSRDWSVDEADRLLADESARADREARGSRRARFVAAGLAIALVFAPRPAATRSSKGGRPSGPLPKPTPAGSVRWPAPADRTTGRCCSRHMGRT